MLLDKFQYLPGDTRVGTDVTVHFGGIPEAAASAAMLRKPRAIFGLWFWPSLLTR
jgi:hypothetical protein